MNKRQIEKQDERVKQTDGMTRDNLTTAEVHELIDSPRVIDLELRKLKDNLWWVRIIRNRRKT